MSRNQREQQYIDPRVQGALWKRLVCHWLAYNVVAMVLVFGLEWMNDPFRPVSEILSTAWWTYGPLLMVLAALVPVFAYDSIRLSHRFAGPVFRLRQVIHSLATGSKPDKVSFREGDFWQELAEDMNRVIDRMGDSPPATKESQS